MRRLALLLTTFGLLVAMSASALAGSPHFVRGPDVTTSGNTLTVTGSIAGLGNVDSAFFELAGTVDVSSRCYTKSGNAPQAANKQELVTVDQDGTFPVRNGRTNVVFTVTPLSTLRCPGGQRVVIESLTYNLLLSGEGLSAAITS